MTQQESFVDIHCHLVPSIDDGSKSWEESLSMARMACADGFKTTIVTPHQLGNFAHNDGDLIRRRTKELQQVLNENQIPLQVLPGGDVRIEPDMIAGLKSGAVMSLADKKKHVLLELPHELYFPLEPVLQSLEAIGMVGILSHPERNQGLLKQQHIVEKLVERGCLMQVTAGSLNGTFGPPSQQMSEWMLEEDLVHFMATDAHGPNSRRPLMRRAFERVTEMVGREVALQVCCENPADVAAGRQVMLGPRRQKKSKSVFAGWFSRRKVA